MSETCTTASNDFDDYGKVITLRGLQPEKALVIKINVEKEIRRRANMIYNRGAKPVYTTGRNLP